MPSPNPLAGLHVGMRRHLLWVIIAWQRGALLVTVVTILTFVQLALWWVSTCLWWKASYIASAAATEAFKELVLPRIGIEIR